MRFLKRLFEAIKKKKMTVQKSLLGEKFLNLPNLSTYCILLKFIHVSITRREFSLNIFWLKWYNDNGLVVNGWCITFCFNTLLKL